ncbi:MAG: DUF1289 domain-containing protein [Amaricoccus sp.]
MSDEIWRREAVESPCIKVCVIHPASGLCLGCYRTAAEIAAWPTLAPEARRALMAALPARASLAKPTRRGGRGARQP